MCSCIHMAVRVTLTGSRTRESGRDEFSRAFLCLLPVRSASLPSRSPVFRPVDLSLDNLALLATPHPSLAAPPPASAALPWFAKRNCTIYSASSPTRLPPNSRRLTARCVSHSSLPRVFPLSIRLEEHARSSVAMRISSRFQSLDASHAWACKLDTGAVRRRIDSRRTRTRCRRESMTDPHFSGLSLSSLP